MAVLEKASSGAQTDLQVVLIGAWPQTHLLDLRDVLVLLGVTGALFLLELVAVTPKVRQLVWILAPLVLAIAVGAAVVLRPADRRDSRRVSVSEIARRLRGDDLSELLVSGHGGEATTRSGDQLTFVAGETSPLKLLSALGVSPDELVRVTYRVQEPPPEWLGPAAMRFPLGLLGGGMVFAWARPGNSG